MTRLSYDAEHALLLLTPQDTVDADEFELWARIFLHFPAIDKLEFEQGADRHLMRFCYNGQRFNLHFEHYSDSLWITAEGIEAENYLSELGEYITTNTIL